MSLARCPLLDNTRVPRNGTSRAAVCVPLVCQLSQTWPNSPYLREGPNSSESNVLSTLTTPGELSPTQPKSIWKDFIISKIAGSTPAGSSLGCPVSPSCSGLHRLRSASADSLAPLVVSVLSIGFLDGIEQMRRGRCRRSGG